jgi:hypothetical protein
MPDFESSIHRAESTATRPRRRFDWPSAAMALVTVLALGWVGWTRFRAAPRPEPPKIGAVPPPLRLRDLETSEPLILLGLRGKVVWLAFWSARSPSRRSSLAELEKVWKRLKSRPHFSMVAVAVDTDRPDLVRAAMAAARADLPVYLATEETRRAFGVTDRNLSLHVLIDDDGRVGVIAHGDGPDTLARLARQVERWLDALEPFGGTRFARRADDRWRISGGVPRSLNEPHDGRF